MNPSMNRAARLRFGRRAVWRWLALPVLASLLAPCAAQELDPAADYRGERGNPVTYQVDFSIVVTAPSHTKKLAVWIPVPGSDIAQQVSGSRWSTFPAAVEPRFDRESTFANQFAYFEFNSPQGGQVIRHQFQITVWEMSWNVDPDRVEWPENWPAAFDKYRRGETQAVIVDQRFQNLMSEIVTTPRGPTKDFHAVIEWVESNFRYDHHQASLRADAEHGLLQRQGHCSDYHGFCASMGRVLGVPTRVAYGINPFPKNSPSHCKLEAYLPPYGWVSFDVSETQKLVESISQDPEFDPERREELIAAARRRLLAGFRDNTWFHQTRGTDYELAPPAQSGRVPVVRTAVVEADGVRLPDPDPGDEAQRQFAWMCVADFQPDRPLVYPLKDWKTLIPKTDEKARDE
jgi:transglutaminase-like putative cysteine protease